MAVTPQEFKKKVIPVAFWRLFLLIVVSFHVRKSPLSPLHFRFQVKTQINWALGKGIRREELHTVLHQGL